MMSSFMFSKFVIILVVLKVGASTSSDSDRINDFHEALKHSDTKAALKWANEIEKGDISCWYETSGVAREWNEWNSRSVFRTTALNLALLYGQENVAMILLKRGADIFVVDGYGNTPLHFAVRHNIPKAASKIMDTMRDNNIMKIMGDNNIMEIMGDNNIMDIMGDNIIMEQVEMSKQQIIDLKNKAGKAPLDIAVSYSRPAVVKILLDEGADPMITDIDGNTALHLAISAHDLHLSTIFHIIEAGGKRSLRQDEIMDQYGGFGASLNRLSLKIFKSFHPSCPEIVNIQNRQGETALHVAVSKTKYSIVQYLLKIGASRTITANGETALEVAEQIMKVNDSPNVEKIVKLLQKMN